MAGLLYFSPLLLAGVGAGYERVARVRSARRFQPPGDFMDVGGHRLHYQIWGAQHLDEKPDQPIILLEADAADWSSHWGRFPQLFSQEYTIVAYDRAGLGWSDPGSGTRDADTLAKELHRFLVNLCPDHKALLVAHGQGTWVARMYAHRYPFETAGMVLIDGEHETFADLARRKSIPSSEASPTFLRLLKMANGLGLCRMAGMELTIPQVPTADFSERDRKAIVARGYQPSILRTIAAEQDAKAQSREQLEGLQDHFEFPIRVLAAANSTLPEQAPKGFPTQEYNELFAKQQEKWAELSTDAECILVEDGNHYLAHSSPDLVRETVIAAARVQTNPSP